MVHVCLSNIMHCRHCIHYDSHWKYETLNMLYCWNMFHNGWFADMVLGLVLRMRGWMTRELTDVLRWMPSVDRGRNVLELSSVLSHQVVRRPVSHVWISNIVFMVVSAARSTCLQWNSASMSFAFLFVLQIILQAFFSWIDYFWNVSVTRCGAREKYLGAVAPNIEVLKVPSGESQRWENRLQVVWGGMGKDVPSPAD